MKADKKKLKKKSYPNVCY